jgi:DNA processing protein
MQVGIVGTRKATPEGKASARELARELAGRGITVVSGLAFGIDAAAHQGALDAGAPTWAVLARGLDAVYPASHRRLADDMLSRGGALISEYPFGSGPRPYRFLERNRIVSGVSRAVLMIEVPARSGAQATARFAAEQGRDVLVVPGPARHPNFRGSHRLIREGAALVADARDVLAELGLELPLPEADISPETGLIRSFLRTVPDAVSIDEIAERANLPPRVVSEHLTLLLLEGKVREEAGLYRNIVE